MKKFFAALLLGCAALAAPAQEALQGYDLARRFTSSRLGNMLFSTYVDPHWTPKGDRFWYSYKTSAGTQWYLVDALSRSRRLLFDQAALAAELSEIIKDPFIAEQLPIEQLEATEDGQFTFQVTSSQDTKKKDKNGKPKQGKEIFYFSYNPDSKKLTLLDKEETEKYPVWASVSPDGKTVVFAKDMNLYRMSREDYEKAKKNENDSTIVETQLTHFGVVDFGFGQEWKTINTDTICNGKRKGQYVAWAPDSKHFAVISYDCRQVKDLWVVNVMSEPRPTLETYKYQMPGEKEAPQEHLYLFDLNNNSYKEIKTAAFKDQTMQIATRPFEQKDRGRHELATVWAGDNNGFYLGRYSRDLHRVDICKYEVGQDSIRPLIEERLNTYIETRPLAVVGNGKELIHWSERSGWAHLYLYDGSTGKLKNQITKGDWHVHDIIKVDEKTRTIYFTADGRKSDKMSKEDEAIWNPYYQKFYRVQFDGSGLKELTHGEFFHTPYMDDNARYFIDNYSRVNTIPCATLYDNNGNKLMELEKSDFSQLFAAGYKFPEPFKVKAADGVTDLYGVMYKPFDFDSTKVYPIIDYVYPGPQVEATNYPFSRMSVRTDRLAQAGFIVITVGNRGGHPNRSKWYHNYGYGNLRDYGLADQRAAIMQLAAQNKFIDINRVGIHGHSGGGFMSTAAILQYPDFFKVAVSCAGNHDNRIFNRWWSETHHGVKEVVSEQGDTTFVYHIATNPEIASRLKGHLLLVHGDIDDNVHPGNTLRVVNALIQSGKRFDMLMLPQQRHSFQTMDEYFYWRLVDYFSEHLLGKKETSVDIPGMK
jgi:dipeptidyl aminopeptidase/acylaminoacyl peptidase